jgi:hypothetical protein
MYQGAVRVDMWWSSWGLKKVSSGVLVSELPSEEAHWRSISHFVAILMLLA